MMNSAGNVNAIPAEALLTPGSYRLVQVVLDDGATLQGTAKHGEAEDRGNGRARHREAELQRDVDERGGHQRADRDAEYNRGDGELAIGRLWRRSFGQPGRRCRPGLICHLMFLYFSTA